MGSATWITDYYGNVKQFMHYMPYGELFLNQQTSHYNERFKFTGKERDTETNYDYFGARFYSPDIAGWLSPDPLSDKYPSINPYAYCNWNPVNRYDPNGKEEWTLDTHTGKFNNIGNKGNSDIDYYSVGSYEDGKFHSYSQYEVEREKGTINSFRIIETENSTISAFHIPENNKEGFFLERPGPDTKQSGESLRIPANQYKLHKNEGTRFYAVPRLYLSSEGLKGPFDSRAILIHQGNYPKDTQGCLLPGSSWTTDYVGNSKATLQSIINYVIHTDWNCKINIFNAFK